MKELTTNELLKKMTGLCSKTEYSRYDIALKLTKWGVAPSRQTEILNYLEQENYIDETRYAQAFTHDKFEYNHWGRLKIRHALILKGITTAAINKALEKITPSDYTQLLKKLLETKARSIKAKDSRERYNKLLRFAAGRGFETDQIIKCLDNNFQ